MRVVHINDAVLIINTVSVYDQHTLLLINDYFNVRTYSGNKFEGKQVYWSTLVEATVYPCYKLKSRASQFYKYSACWLDSARQVFIHVVNVKQCHINPESI